MKLEEIDSIYLTGLDNPGFYKKENIHNFLLSNPNTIFVDRYPYPALVPATSVRGEKYVRSVSNGTTTDNLLNLPRI